ncbi:MAG: glutathione peroxidase [Methylophaga sp.]|nr:glutathione peroxidase [Methylophaga sp.]
MMRVYTFAALLLLSFLSHGDSQCPTFLDYDLPKLHAKDTVNLCDAAAGKPLLVINTASHCGYTKQFEGLEALHKKYKDQGLMVVGFASNDFNQEAQTEEEANQVCRESFGVTFTMIAPSYVTGQRANPVFQEINQQSNEPGWNFSKYLLNSHGKVIAAFPSKAEPDSAELTEAIESLL